MFILHFQKSSTTSDGFQLPFYVLLGLYIALSIIILLFLIGFTVIYMKKKPRNEKDADQKKNKKLEDDELKEVKSEKVGVINKNGMLIF